LDFPILSQESLRDMLADREWHSLEQIVERIRVYVPAEYASRFWIDQIRGEGPKSRQIRKNRQDSPYDSRVYEGLMLLALNGMRNLRDLKIVEIKGDKRYQQFRRLDWFCWSCGAVCSIGGEDPRDREPSLGLCRVCLSLHT